MPEIPEITEHLEFSKRFWHLWKSNDRHLDIMILQIILFAIPSVELAQVNVLCLF